MLKTQQAQLQQLITATHDSKIRDIEARDYLVLTGYAQRRNGWNIATIHGVFVAENLKLIKP